MIIRPYNNILVCCYRDFFIALARGKQNPTNQISLKIKKAALRKIKIAKLN